MATPIVTAVAVYEAGKKAYEAYQGIVAFVSLGSHTPTPEEEILARLEVLHQDFVALQGRFDEVLEAVKQAVRVEQQAYVLNLRRDLEGLRGRARTATDELSAWVADGRKDPLLRSNADNNSRLRRIRCWRATPTSTARIPIHRKASSTIGWRISPTSMC